MPYTYFSDLIVGETTCDGKKKMYELLGRLKPVYTLHLPQGLDGCALESWTAELRRFIAFLEDRFGVCVTDAALREAAAAGVGVFARDCLVTPESLTLDAPVPVVLEGP